MLVVRADYDEDLLEELRTINRQGGLVS